MCVCGVRVDELLLNAHIMSPFSSIRLYFKNKTQNFLQSPPHSSLVNLNLISLQIQRAAAKHQNYKYNYPFIKNDINSTVVLTT